MGSGVWGSAANFNGFCVLAVLLHGTRVVGVSQTLRRWTEGATYIWQGSYNVGHWPTFYFGYTFSGIAVWSFKFRSCFFRCCIFSVPWLSVGIKSTVFNRRQLGLLVATVHAQLNIIASCSISTFCASINTKRLPVINTYHRTIFFKYSTKITIKTFLLVYVDTSVTKTIRVSWNANRY